MRKFAIFAAINGFLAVLLGAFGAHVLQNMVDARFIEVWKTAVQYQMFHSLILLVLSLNSSLPCSAYLQRAGVFFAAGISLFSGSLYLLVITGFSPLGMITPLGGLSFLAGWLTLIFWLVKRFQAPQGSD